MSLDLLGPASSNAVTARPARGVMRGIIDTWFRNCSSPLVEDGTTLDADFFNDILANVRTVVRGSQVRLTALTNTDLDQLLWHAILTRSVRHAVAGGTADALTATFTPPVNAVWNGLMVSVKVTATNTGAATLKPDDAPEYPIRNRDNSALSASALLAGSVVVLIYNDGVWQIVGPQAVLYVEGEGGEGGEGEGGACCAGVTGQLVLASGTAALPGTIKANGAELLRASYPNLWTYANASGRVVSQADWANASLRKWASYSSGDGSTTFRVPDFRGEFLRMWDDGRGVDASRNIGTQQADDFKSHAHTLATFGSDVIAIVGSSWPASAADPSSGIIQASPPNGPITVAAAGGTETRPRNVAVTPCIVY